MFGPIKLSRIIRPIKLSKIVQTIDSPMVNRGVGRFDLDRELMNVCKHYVMHNRAAATVATCASSSSARRCEKNTSSLLRQLY